MTNNFIKQAMIFDIEKEKCRFCNSSLGLVKQKFNDGSIHNRVECNACKRFHRYAPSKESSFKERLFQLARSLSEVQDIDYKTMVQLRSDARRLMAELTKAEVS